MFQSLMTTLLFLLIFTTSSFSTTDTIDIDKLSLQAKKENKHLLLFFHKYRCGFCEKMLYDILKDIDIEDMVEEYFIFVDINIDDEGSIWHRDFRVLAKHSRPAVLVECGYLTNKKEAEKLNTAWYRAKIAKLITDGIVAALGEM